MMQHRILCLLVTGTVVVSSCAGSAGRHAIDAAATSTRTDLSGRWLFAGVASGGTGVSTQGELPHFGNVMTIAQTDSLLIIRAEIGGRRQIDESVFALDGKELTRPATYPDIPGNSSREGMSRTTRVVWEREQLLLEISESGGFYPSIIRRYRLRLISGGRLEVIYSHTQLMTGGTEPRQVIFFRARQW
jgi:hypothetical protein